MPSVTRPLPRGNQLSVVGAPLAPLSVIACAGSGKTLTAVHRLAAMSRLLHDVRTRVALLSFSNVAVDTFKDAFDQLKTDSRRSRAVEITTLDSFLATNILKTHSHRTMGYEGVPYLVSGKEPFLAAFNVRTASHPISIAKVSCERIHGQWRFFHQPFSDKVILLASNVMPVLRRLGSAGAYTHNLGRYWAYETLQQQPAILRSLANRYKHILIDEAQDLGSAHQGIIRCLIEQGVHVSLIGDPNQGIYEFAGADGNFLRGFEQSHAATPFQLTENFRSVPAIVTVANNLSGRDDTPTRQIPSTPNGAFYIGYANNSEVQLVARFIAAVGEAGLQLDKSAVLCRGNALCEKLRGEAQSPGQGIVAIFAKAAYYRDYLKDYSSAFTIAITGIALLLENPPKDFSTRVGSSDADPTCRRIRRLLWNFVSKRETGLPHIHRLGQDQWHPELVASLSALLDSLAAEYDLACVSNLGQKLARRRIPTGPLYALAQSNRPSVRIDTVHQAKGESLDAVLYLVTKPQAEALLEGVSTEIGRIGYVAVTRAKDIFWLGIPQNAVAPLEPVLQQKGFNRV